MTARRTIVIGLAGLLLSGLVAACAPARIELDPRVRERLPSASAVDVVVYPAEPPPLMTATAIMVGSLFGPLGGAVAGARAASVGKELMAKHNVVEDLSTQLARKLTDALEPTLPNLRPAAKSPPNAEMESLKNAGLGPVVLDVGSGGTIFYDTSIPPRYRLLYTARVRLVDTEQGRVLWQGYCDPRRADDPARRPTLEELEAADGVAYRRLITEATAACVTELLKQFRGEAPPG